MAIQIPRKIGEEKVLARVFGKSLITQDYENSKTGKAEPWGKFHGKHISSFVLPITVGNKVVAIRQFRYGADELILELPAGNIVNELPEEAAKRELLEEAGYEARQTISLSHGQPVWHDPASTNFRFYPFLCLDCVLKDKQKLDENEDIEVALIELRDWIDMVYKIQANSSYAMLTTLLALPYLQL